MAREELIERLAKANYDQTPSYKGAPTPWEQVIPEDQALFREPVMRYLPLIVAFVAEYMADLGKTHLSAEDAERIAACWTHEMSGDA